MEVSGKQEMEVHHTISELMIAANAGVAGIVFGQAPLQTLLRIHPPPSEEKLRLLQAEVAETGVDIFQSKASSSAEMRAQLRLYRERVSKGVDSSIVDLLTTSVIRAMNEAKYVCSGTLTGELFGAEATESSSGGRYRGHFGLGLRLYTHFTSPIRRYADVIVHRQLLSVIESAEATDVPTANDKPTNPPLPSLPPTRTLHEAPSDDVDFLDELLEGVGDDLLASSVNNNLLACHQEVIAASVLEPSEPNSSMKNVPYQSAELEYVAQHLNSMNRRSKQCQMACQKLFLCLYFSSRSEVHQGIVAGLRENGFMYDDFLHNSI